MWSVQPQTDCRPLASFKRMCFLLDHSQANLPNSKANLNVSMHVRVSICKLA